MLKQIGRAAMVGKVPAAHALRAPDPEHDVVSDVNDAASCTRAVADRGAR